MATAQGIGSGLDTSAFSSYWTTTSDKSEHHYRVTAANRLVDAKSHQRSRALVAEAEAKSFVAGHAGRRLGLSQATRSVVNAACVASDAPPSTAQVDLDGIPINNPAGVINAFPTKATKHPSQ